MCRTGWVVLVAVGIVLGLCRPARAVDEDDIRRAAERGAAALKRIQSDDGNWPFIGDQGWNTGASALAVLALLECGADPASDPALRKALTYLREASVQLTSTYAISLCIMVFDRVGEVADQPLIESLTVRLLAGQSAEGGWSYNCPRISQTEVR